MEPLRTVTGIVAPLPRADVDTDQIIPKQFLKRVERAGYGQFLFHDWRHDEDGAPRPDFVLNRPEYAGASVLATGRNFGCGSSREHAAWALSDHGFRVVVAPGFADIFRSNCYQNGLLPLELDEATVDDLVRRAEERPGYSISVSLESLEAWDEDGWRIAFELDDFRRRCLMEGLDDIGLTLENAEAIDRFEARRTAASSRG